MAYAHAKGVIHRDLKPAQRHGRAASARVYVMDWGLARVSSEPSRMRYDVRRRARHDSAQTKPDSGASRMDGAVLRNAGVHGARASARRTSRRSRPALGRRTRSARLLYPLCSPEPHAVRHGRRCARTGAARCSTRVRAGPPPMALRQLTSHAAPIWARRDTRRRRWRAIAARSATRTRSALASDLRCVTSEASRGRGARSGRGRRAAQVDRAQPRLGDRVRGGDQHPRRRRGASSSSLYVRRGGRPRVRTRAGSWS